MSKCDRIFDELARLGKIKFSHTIPSVDELKRRAYCKLHNTFSHATNDCNVLRRQIQSAIDEGRLVISGMQVDQNPFPMHTHVLELKNPKVLIRPNQQMEKTRSLEKRDTRRRCSRTKPLEILQHSGGKTKGRLTTSLPA